MPSCGHSDSDPTCSSPDSHEGAAVQVTEPELLEPEPDDSPLPAPPGSTSEKDPVSTRPPQPATISAAPTKKDARSDGEAKRAEGHRDEGMAHVECTQCATSRHALNIPKSRAETGPVERHPTTVDVPSGGDWHKRGSRYFRAGRRRSWNQAR